MSIPHLNELPDLVLLSCSASTSLGGMSMIDNTHGAAHPIDSPFARSSSLPLLFLISHTLIATIIPYFSVAPVSVPVPGPVDQSWRGMKVARIQQH